MRHAKWLASIVFAASLESGVQAGDWFSRTSQGKLDEQLPRLLSQVASDKEEGKREEAAKELRRFDGKSHPEVVITLCECLERDSSASVRTEAAKSLGKLTPTSIEAARALEEATRDKSLRVRMQARTSLIGYRVNSAKNAMGTAQPTTKPNMPPVVVTATPSQSNPRSRISLQSLKGKSTAGQTNSPPLAEVMPRWESTPESVSHATLKPALVAPVLLTPPNRNPKSIVGPDLTPPD